MPKRYIVAIDSLKGCLTSKEANDAARQGIHTVVADAEVLEIPVSDGGEGWLEAYQSAIGGDMVERWVFDPMMRRVTARYLMKEDTAVIEIAQASGLTLVSEEERNPMKATSYGTGQLIVDAVRRGCRRCIVGLGGSATSDCGMGMLRALIDAFAKGGSWDDVEALKSVQFTIATDVNNPLCGERGAAHVFAPQKGATPEMVVRLDERARQFAEKSSRHFGYDRQNEPGAGAAGGLGYAFMQYLNATCRPGVELLMEAVGFDDLVKNADMVFTGEGSADSQTLMGKLPFGVMQKALRQNKPVCLIAGRVRDREELLKAGFAQVECINPPVISLAEAMKKENAQQHIKDTVSRLVQI